MDAFEAFKDGIAEIERIASHAGELLSDRASLDLANAITRSGVVLLCGYFEGYIRDLLKEAVDRVNDAGLDANLLPERLFFGLIDAAFAQNGSQRVDAVLQIRDHLKDRRPCKLDRDRLSVTQGNPKVDVIEGLLEAIGIPAVIDDLSIRDFGVGSTFSEERQSKRVEAAVVEALGPDQEHAVTQVLRIIDDKWAPKRRRRPVGYVGAVQELLKRRNRIAHGESRELVTPEDLRGHARVIAGLAQGLAEKVSEFLYEISPVLITR